MSEATTKTVQCYRANYGAAGNGPLCDTIEDLLDDIKNRLEDQPQDVSIVCPVWTKANFDKLPEFEGY